MGGVKRAEEAVENCSGEVSVVGEVRMIGVVTGVEVEVDAVGVENKRVES